MTNDLDAIVRWFSNVLDEDEVRAKHVSRAEFRTFGEAPRAAAAFADIGAKRAVIKEYLDATKAITGSYEEGLGTAIRMLVTAYAHRPGYQPDWGWVY